MTLQQWKKKNIKKGVNYTNNKTAEVKVHKRYQLAKLTMDENK